MSHLYYLETRGSFLGCVSETFRMSRRKRKHRDLRVDVAIEIALRELSLGAFKEFSIRPVLVLDIYVS